MAFVVVWDKLAEMTYKDLENHARKSVDNRSKSRKSKASREEGLFNQVRKCINLLRDNPRHPSLQTHQFESAANPYDPNGKVFEAYAQQNTPGAYRVFWCYGPGKGEITIIAILPHP